MPRADVYQRDIAEVRNGGGHRIRRLALFVEADFAFFFIDPGRLRPWWSLSESNCALRSLSRFLIFLTALAISFFPQNGV